MSKRIVIALGGNALGSTAAEQLALVSKTAKAIVDLILSLIHISEPTRPY